MSPRKSFPEVQTEPEFVVPSLRDTSPKYAELVDRKAHLLQQDAELAEEYNAIYAAARDGYIGSLDPTDLYVKALIDGKDPIQDQSPNRERIEWINKHRAKTKVAVRELEKQITQEEAYASAKICADLRPYYERRLRSLVEHLLMVRLDTIELFKLQREVDREGVRTGYLENLMPHFLGNPWDTESPLAFYLGELASRQVVSADVLPAEFKATAYRASAALQPEPPPRPPESAEETAKRVTGYSYMTVRVNAVGEVTK